MARLRRAGAEEGLSTRQRILCPDRSVGWESGGGKKRTLGEKKTQSGRMLRVRMSPAQTFGSTITVLAQYT